MKIVLFHPVRLPPAHYGGVERVVLWLAGALVALGHEVWVAALSGSTAPRGAHLIEMEPGRTSAEDLLPVIPPGVDVVHFHAPPEAGVWERLPAAAILTVHGNGKPGERFPLNTVFLSRDHARRHGGRTFVHNGLDPGEYLFNPSEKTDRYLFLSKTSWKVKNVRGAIRLCHRAGVGLDVAGGNRPWGPRLRAALDPALRWVGPVNGRGKAELLARARGLVFPILWPEPFGLVVIEALVSGTPVLAPPLGSLPELVSPEVGLLIDGEDEGGWIEALRSPAGRFSPEACRDWALKNFHFHGMAKAYLSLYEKVAAGESLQDTAPSVPPVGHGPEQGEHP